MKFSTINFSSFAVSAFLKSVLAASLLAFSVMAWAVPVNVNKADSALIADSLKGIGLKTAEKIVKYREKNGAFKKVDDLLSIRGIGEKKLEKIRKDIKLKD